MVQFQNYLPPTMSVLLEEITISAASVNISQELLCAGTVLSFRDSNKSKTCTVFKSFTSSWGRVKLQVVIHGYVFIPNKFYKHHMKLYISTSE